MEPNWNPISTAPKDERDLLLFGPDRQGMRRPVVVAGWFERNVEPNWYSHELIDDPIDMVPTHWMHLPPTPEDIAATSPGAQEDRSDG